jgi:peptide/nickel transport system substrate-binding protein
MAVLVTGALVGAACGGGGGPGEDGTDDADRTASTDVLDNPKWAHVVSGPQASDDTPMEGGSIVVGLGSEPNSLLPSGSTSGQTGRNVTYAIFDPLVTRDAEGNVRPYLAESVEPNDDFTEWTLTLRPDVRFHDGTPLNAAAMKRIWDDYLVAPGAVTFTTTRFVERMDVVDELTVRYVMTNPNPTFPELLELQIGWPFSPDAADELGEEFGERPVGTGPFRFVSWERDSELVLERNDDYWQEGLPYLDRISFRPIPDESTRAASLASGDVDAVQSASLSDFAATVADIEGTQVVLGLGNRGSGALFNTTSPPTDDLRIRQALAHAVDQEALVEVAAGEAAELTELRTQFFTEDSPFYSQAVADAWLGHDPEAARQLYEDYVNDPQRSDDKAVGEPVSLTFGTPNTPSSVELATAYVGFYEEVGFDVTVEPLEPSQLSAAAVADDYEAQIFPLGLDSSPLGEFQFFFDDPSQIITNFSNFYDDRVASLIEQLRRTGDVAEQAELAEAMGLHLAENVPFQWTGTDLTLIAARDNVRGLRSWVFPDGTLGDAVHPGVAFWGQVWLDG